MGVSLNRKSFEEIQVEQTSTPNPTGAWPSTADIDVGDQSKEEDATKASNETIEISSAEVGAADAVPR